MGTKQAAICVGLMMLQIQVAVQTGEYINATVNIENGTKSVDLSCGEIPDNAVAIEWYIKAGEWKRILKFYPTELPEYYNNYNEEKYGISESVNTSLIIRNIELSDSGMFICATTGGLLSYTYTTLLNVVDEATTTCMTKFPKLAVDEGAEAEYICETDFAYPDAPVVLWSMNDVPMAEHDVHTENFSSPSVYHGKMTRSVLRFKAKREMNNKNVTCVLGNDGTKLSKHNLHVKFEPDKLEIHIGDAVKEHIEKSVECEASSSNPVSLVDMEFFINGTKERYKIHTTQTPGSHYGMVKTFTYTFKTDRSQNGRIAKCQLLWNGTDIEKKAEAILNIMYPPEISVEGTSTPVVEYTTRNIVCRTKGGNPSGPKNYNYEWIYKPTYGPYTKYIPVPSGSALISGGKKLRLKDLGYENMAGTYKCTATGIGGQSSGSSTLEVYYAAKSENTLEDMTVYSVLESNVNLTVKFRMNPVSNYAIHWWMGGSELPNTNVGYAVKKEYVETTYFISNMTQEQLGNYTVHVINWAITGEHNKVTFNVILKLPGPPQKPRKIAIIDKTHNSITISWEAGLNGGSEQYFKVLYRVKGNKNYQESQHSIRGLKTGQSINYTIHGLVAKEEYEIIVVAINQFTNSSQSPSDIQTATTEDIGNLIVIVISMGAIVGLLIIIIIVIGCVWCKSRKSKSRKSSQGEYQMDTGPSKEYEGISMDNRIEIRSVAGIYSDLQRNSQQYMDREYECIPEDIQSHEVTDDTGYLEPVSILTRPQKQEPN